MFMYNYDSFLRMLKTIRYGQKAKQQAVADGIGLERTAYGRRESGEIEMTVRELIDLANYYKISPASFFTVSVQADKDVQRIIDLLGQVPDDEKGQLYQMILWAVRGLKNEGDIDNADTAERSRDRRDSHIAIADERRDAEDNTNNTPAGGKGTRKARRK